MALAKILEGFTERLGLGMLSPDEDNVYRMVFDDVLEIEVAPLGETHVRVRGHVGDDLPEAPGGDHALEELLQVNLARLRRRREVLTRDRSTRKIALSRLEPLNGLDVERFYVIIEEFLDSLSLCRAAFLGSTSTSSPAAAPFGPAFRPFG